MTQERVNVLKSIRRAADLLGPENDRERLAMRVLLQLANSLEFGGSYKVTGAAEEFDYASSSALPAGE